MAQPDLILASASPYRQQLLRRLGLPFSCVVSGVDESAQPAEVAHALVERLAMAKARAVAVDHPQAVIIGSDQVLSCGGEILGKPGNHARAGEQLRKMSGQMAVFSTGICVLDPRTGSAQADVIDVEVLFRKLDNDEIERYLLAEQPYDCAGSFKSEQLGISLTAGIRGDDPTALVGLPLVRLSEMLRDLGYRLP
ncbi:MAG: Maf family nucleotide pyrophosphatase [Thiotrichales bacterium]|nr:Maf family nucleotide pyrophosphatase [Thiotrichales bacterium]